MICQSEFISDSF